MKNKLVDLNNHLFAQMERLSDEDITHDKMKEEIDRSKAITNLAAQMIANARLVLDAQVKINDGLIKKPPAMLGINGHEQEPI